MEIGNGRQLAACGATGTANPNPVFEPLTLQSRVVSCEL